MREAYPFRLDIRSRPLDGLSPSSLQVEYLDEVHYPGIYQLRVGVLELDATAVRYACGLFDGPRCIGAGRGGRRPRRRRRRRRTWPRRSRNGTLVAI